MGLREIAEADLAVTLEDVTGGGAWAIELIAPDRNSHGLSGLSGDIGAVIDLQTGMPVAGRSAHVSLRMSSILAAGFDSLPKRVDNFNGENSNPWQVKFLDLAGNEHAFIVRDSKPDRTLGLITLTLEFYAD